MASSSSPSSSLPSLKIGLKIWETGLEAEHILSQQVPILVKALFLATNLPYWLLFYVALREALRGLGIESAFIEDNGNFVAICGRAEIYALLLFIVAASSTTMHASQLRLGEFMCCAHPGRTECFHRRENLKTMKKADIFCALVATIACVACHDWADLFYTFVLAFPLFVSGLVLKRLGWNYSYMLVHGLWHIVTAGLVWDAVMTWYDINPY